MAKFRTRHRVVGRDDDVLALTEHFLPILRSDDLMPYAVPQTCQWIFEVRVGRRLRDCGAPGLDPAVLTAEFHRGVEEEIHGDHAQRAADVICRGAPAGPFERIDLDLDLDLAGNDVREGHPSWNRALDRFETVLHVAREAWQFEQRPPGAALRGLWLLVEAIYDESDNDDDRRPKGRRRAALNLLDCLQPGGMERRIAGSSRDMLGTNAPLAHLLLEAHADLER